MDNNKQPSYRKSTVECDIILELQEEEQRGLFRNISPQFAREANAYYKQLTKGRFEFVNPMLECLAGTRFDVFVETGTTRNKLSHGYVNIVMTPHGWFAQIHPNQLVIPLREMNTTRGTPLSTICGWLSFRFGQCDVYYAGHQLPGSKAVLSELTTVPINIPHGQTSIMSYVNSQSMNTTVQKPVTGTKYRKMKEFAPGFVYVNLQNVIILRSTEKNVII